MWGISTSLFLQRKWKWLNWSREVWEDYWLSRLAAGSVDGESCECSFWEQLFSTTHCSSMNSCSRAPQIALLVSLCDYYPLLHKTDDYIKIFLNSRLFFSFLPSLSLGLQRILFLNNLFCWLLYRSLSPFERMWNSIHMSHLITMSVSIRLAQSWENQSRKTASCRSSLINLRINRQPYQLRAAFCLVFCEWVYIGPVKIQFHIFQCTYNFM